MAAFKDAVSYHICEIRKSRRYKQQKHADAEATVFSIHIDSNPLSEEALSP